MTHDTPLSDIIKQALVACVPRRKPKREKYHSKLRETRLQLRHMITTMQFSKEPKSEVQPLDQ
jgi:hypothetical protein